MATLLDQLRTPHKLGRLVIEPSGREGDFDRLAADCPFPFRHAGRFHMTYIGWDGQGYQTGLASSDDLLTWHKQGLLIGRGGVGSITEHNVALTNILRDNDLHGSAEPIRVAGLYWGTYHAYPAAGYEVGAAVIGLCSSRDLQHWDLHEPILRAEDGAGWERGGLYKSWLLAHGGQFYLFYNAKDRADGPWREQTGVAISTDMKRWVRHPGNPVVTNGPAGSFDEIFASDPYVLRVGSTWAMFYFGLAADGHARNSVAFSDDLLHWRKADELLLDIGPAGSVDSTHAHKPGVIGHRGVVYHFYCAVAPGSEVVCDPAHRERRGIALATSRAVG